MDPITMYCDTGCEKELQPVSLKLVKLRMALKRHTPHCKHEYVAYYSSDETKTLQKELRQLHVKMRTAAGTPQDMESLVKEQDLQVRIKQSMDEAKRIAENEQTTS